MAFMVAVALVSFWLLAGTFRSWPHDAADWIRLQNLKNRIGELCCGERDCVRLDDDDVISVPNGFYIRSLKETVPSDEALPVSPDGFWRCQWGGQRKCFITPAMGS